MSAARLAESDARTLYLQTPTTPAYTVSVVVLEPSPGIDHAVLRGIVAVGLPRLPRFRGRLVDKPLGIGLPVWADIEGYDAHAHVHSASVPAPGGQRELAELVGRLAAAAQQESKSLWQAWTIDGLAEGRWAVAVMTSPALGTAPVTDLLLSAEPHPAGHPTVGAGFGPAPSVGGLVADAVTEMVQGQMTGARILLGGVSQAWRAARQLGYGPTESATDTTAVASMRGPVPATVFGAPLTARRSMRLASVRLDDVEAVSDAFGCNTATVVLTALTLSLRAWLGRHDTVPAHPLLFEVPVSSPSGDPADGRNASAIGQIRSPVQLDDPVQILTNLHTATERLNIANHFDPEIGAPAGDLDSLMMLLPPWAMRWAMALGAEVGQAAWHTPTGHCSVSFVSAPHGYCGAARVAASYTSAPLAHSRGLSLTVTTGTDIMDVCVTACPDNVAAIGEISEGIVDAVGVLTAAAMRSPRGEGRSVVTEMNSYSRRRL